MLEEANTQSRALGGTFDQSRNVCHHKASVTAHPHYTQVGHQGGKGVVGHLGAGRRNRANKGGFTGIGQAQQTHICQHLQFQFDLANLTLGSRRGLPRRPVNTGLKAGVTQPMEATLSHFKGLAQLSQVAEYFAGLFIQHRGSHRNIEHQVLAAGSGAVRSPARLAILGFEVAGVAKVDKRVQTLGGQQDNAAAIAAIAAVRATFGDIFLPAKAHTAVTAVARLDFNCCFVDKFHGVSLPLPPGCVISGHKCCVKQR